MTLEARPPVVAIDATSLIVAKIVPFTPVTWALEGNGTLYPLDDVSDVNGVVSAKLVPTGSPGDAIRVIVKYVSS